MEQYQQSGPPAEKQTAEVIPQDVSKLQQIVSEQGNEITQLKKQLRQLKTKVDEALAIISYLGRGR